jgi:hypothetical protein
VSNPGPSEADKPVVTDELPPSRGLRWVAAFLGLAVLALGGIATFRSTNGAGSAALVVGGIALLVLSGLADRIELLKVGNVEFHVRAAASQLIRRADELEMQGDTAAAEHLRSEAEHLLLQATPTARRYEELRRIQPPGRERTAEFRKLVDHARKFSREKHPSAEVVRGMFEGGSEGDRVYALVLMQEDPAAGDLSCVIGAISESRSAYEQYRALRAAEEMLRMLNSSERKQLATAIQQAMEPGGYITRSSDRYGLAQNILNMVADRAPRRT